MKLPLLPLLPPLLVAWIAGTSILASAVPQSVSALARKKIDVAKLGPQVGERAPDFSLKDQNGSTQTLRSMMGPKGAMLVFIRSADW
jgi:hypothetical protein